LLMDKTTKERLEKRSRRTNSTAVRPLFILK
jgi:hypothetical protein